MTRPDRWEKAADRDLARRRRAAGPLFAPLVERRDPEEVREKTTRSVDAHMQQIADFQAELERRGQESRTTLAAHISPEELAELDRRRTWYPPGGAYTADHYCGECRKRGLPWPGKEEHDAFLARLAEVDAIVAAREAAKGEQLALPTGVRIRMPRARIEDMSREEQEALDAELEAAAEADAIANASAAVMR